jgi:hypothetical protein
MRFDRAFDPEDGPGDAILQVTVTGELFDWRGPAPHVFLAVPEEPSAAIRALSPMVTYGWGVIPVTVRLGGSTWTTSLFPRDGRYLVPIKLAVRRAEGIAPGDTVTVELSIGA